MNIQLIEDDDGTFEVDQPDLRELTVRQLDWLAYTCASVSYDKTQRQHFQSENRHVEKETTFTPRLFTPTDRQRAQRQV